MGCFLAHEMHRPTVLSAACPILTKMITTGLRFRIQSHSLRWYYWAFFVPLSHACLHPGFLCDSKALWHFNMLCLSRLRKMKGDRNNESAVQCWSKAVCVMKCMGVNNKTFDRVVLDIGSEWIRYNSFLYQWLFTRCCAFCERAIMLHVVNKFNALPYCSERISEYRSINCLHTVDGITT